MHILHVVGARPNFMKAAPVLRALTAFTEVRQTLVRDRRAAQAQDPEVRQAVQLRQVGVAERHTGEVKGLELAPALHQP